MRVRRVPEPIDDEDYVFELKVDGFRALVYLGNGECRLVSRNLKSLRFESLKEVLAKLPVKNLDGEIICLDSRGASQFNALLGRKVEPILYAFDLLWLDGEDLRKLPLIGSRKRLAIVSAGSPCEHGELAIERPPVAFLEPVLRAH